MPSTGQAITFPPLPSEQQTELINKLLDQGKKWNDTVLTNDDNVRAIRVMHLDNLLHDLTRASFTDDIDFNQFTYKFIEIVYMYVGNHYDTQFEQVQPIQHLILQYYPQQRMALHGYEEIDDDELV